MSFTKEEKIQAVGESEEIQIAVRMLHALIKNIEAENFVELEYETQHGNCKLRFSIEEFEQKAKEVCADK